MPQAKTHLFKQKEIALAELAKSLGHPARVAILKTLSRRNECVCGEIVGNLPLAQATVSQHLKELKAVGLISGEVDGPKSCYCINWKRIEELQHDLDEFFATLKSARERCC